MAVTLTKPDGTVCELCMWLAATREERARGLMQVTDLAGYDGMVFRYDAPVTSGFWMKNTVMPLSLVYVDEEGKVVTTLDMEPCTRTDSTCPIYRPAGAFVSAIEVPKGSLARLGFVDGVTITYSGNCERSAG